MNTTLRVAALAAAFSIPALTAQGADNSDSQLETINVIGERVTLKLNEEVGNGSLGTRTLLDTPFSVTSVDWEDIARRQATTIGQIFINDPSVFAAEPSASTNWWGTQIRGLGVRSHYVDGVPVLMEWGGQFPLESVETVTALKGLGGFMYGFGSPGGIISYETKKPTNQTLLSASATVRNDSAISLHLDAGGRLAGPDSFGYRLNVAGEQGDAYNGAGIDRNLVSLAVDQQLGLGFTWFAEGFHEYSKLKHEPLYFYWDLYEGDALPSPTYDYENVSVRNSWYKSKTAHATTGLRWRVSDAWNAQLTYGYSRHEHYSNKMFADLLNEDGDYDGSVYNFAGVLRTRIVQALAQGKLDTGPIGHQLVVGAAYQRSEDQWSNEWYWSNDFSGNLYQRQDYLVTREPDFSLEEKGYGERQKALFASDTLEFGRHLQAIIGARHTRYDTDGYDIKELTPTLALIYKPIQQVSIYGSYVESLEAGSRVGPEFENAGELLKATVSKQHEVGAKYAAGRFGFTTAAFRVQRASQIERLADTDIDGDGTIERILNQDGLVDFRGIEAIGSLGLGDGLRVGLGATWLDATIQDVSADNEDLEGKRPAGSTPLQAVANFEYQLPFLRELALHGNARYFGRAYYEDMNRIRIPDRTIASLGFQYATSIGGRKLSLTGNVNNLFNRKYWNLDTLGEARNASLSARLQW